MTNKAYIVANEQQKNKIREKSNDKADFDSQAGDYEFPYVLVDSEADGWIYYSTMWSAEYDFGDHLEIVYDGRKEELMADKYVVSQEFMNELVDWRDNNELQTTFISSSDLFHFPNKIVGWLKDTNTLFDNRNRLIAIIRWLNGEDVFEVEKPKKWVVRSKDIDEEGDYGYIFINPYNITLSTYSISQATHFDTKEEAESWANAHQEVVEVDE